MVLFLLRRDYSVKIALFCALLAPAVLLDDHFGPLLFLQQMAFIGVFAAVRLQLLQRSTRLQAGLPIPGRDLLSVRLAGVLLAVWFPVTVAVLFLAANHREGSVTVFQGGAVLTAAAFLPLTWRLREASISPLAQIGLPASILVVGAATWFVLPPLAHLAIFGALSVGLGGRAWGWRQTRLRLRVDASRGCFPVTGGCLRLPVGLWRGPSCRGWPR